MEKYNESLRLILAVKDGRLKDVISCLDKGAEINCQDEVEDYPIHIAAAKGYMEIVRLLLDQGSDCNLKARYTENSPLHLAAEGGYVKTTELLLMRGGDPSIKNRKGESPLHRPALDGHLDVVTLLLNAGSDSNIATYRLNRRDVGHPFDSTPLHYAVESGKLNTVSLFVERASDLSWMNIFKALYQAAKDGQFEILRVLLIFGCDPKIKNELGETPYDRFKNQFRDYSVDLSVSKLLELIQVQAIVII